MRARASSSEMPRPGDVRLDHLAAALGFELQRPIEVAARVEEPGEQVDVGDGGFGPAETEAGWSRGGADAGRADLDVSILQLDHRASTHAVAGDSGQFECRRDALDRSAPFDVDGAVADDADVGCRAADVDHEHVGEAVAAGKRPGPFESAARTGTVALDCRGFGHSGRAAVVAENQERPAGAELAQPPLGVEQKALHRRMEESVEQARPGAAHVVAVGGEFPGEEQAESRPAAGAGRAAGAIA